MSFGRDSARKRCGGGYISLDVYCTVGPISENINFLARPGPFLSAALHEQSQIQKIKGGGQTTKLHGTARPQERLENESTQPVAWLSICSQLLQRVVAIDAHGFIGKFLPDKL